MVPRRFRERLRRRLGRRPLAARLPRPAPDRPEPVRPRSTAPTWVLQPARTRYQRRSAGLPQGVDRFRGLGEAASGDES